MNQSIFSIESNQHLTDSVLKLVMAGDTSAITAPGQFINIKLNGFFLRRPISVCDYNEKSITILYKVVGKGTRYLSTLSTGTSLDVLTGLGNGYDLEKSGKKPLLIGGGVGVPPMYRLTKELLAQKKHPIVILGFRTKAEEFYADKFRELGAVVHIATEDGSLGTKGFVTDVISSISDYSYFYSCGPEAMLKAVSDVTSTSGQLSFEERMGCGFGACMGCSCKTKYGTKRICKDGPVLEKEEIIW